MPRKIERTVSLTAADRGKLNKVVSSETHRAKMVTRARILLALDQTDRPAEDRRAIAHRLGTSEGTVYVVAKQFSETGGRVEAVLARKRRVSAPVKPKVTGEVQARIVALARTQPPEGFSRWSLRLLERQVLITDGIPPLDHTTIGRALKAGHVGRLLNE